jgi:hypothetical protein
MANPDNPELLEELTDAVLDVADELALLRQRAFPPKPPVILTGEPGWPSAPGTLAQGFLNSRWNRRDGNVYNPPSTTGGDNPQAQTSRAGRRQRTGARSDH